MFESLEQVLEYAAASRGALKRAGAWLDGDGAALKAELVQRVGPDRAAGMPGKKLLRLALNRAADAQVRSNPVRMDQAFTCVSCGRDAPLGGARVRNHCPWCLCSLHLDHVPGDRASACGGQMTPVGVERRGDDWILHHRCVACGATGRVRSHPTDDPAALARVSASVDP